jgi:polyhydroxybutyrate depolymerase
MAAAGEARQFSLPVDGLIRTYTVFEPSNYRGQQQVPLIVMLHGAGGTGMGVIRETAWDRKAEQAGVLVVFPDAVRPNQAAQPSFLVNPQIWNDGSGRGAAFLHDVNDVKFLALMLDQLMKTYTIDPRAVYLTGFSNGASMALRAAGELPGRFAAVAAVSGPYWGSGGILKHKAPLPTLFIAGTADPLNPFPGGTISLPWGTFEQPPLMATIINWARCNGVRDRLQLTANGTEVQIFQGTGENQIPVQAYIVNGLGHLWPGGEPIFPAEYIGTDPGLLNATDTIWEFFIKYGSRKQ